MKCGARKSDNCPPSQYNILERGSTEQKADFLWVVGGWFAQRLHFFVVWFEGEES